MLMPADAPGMPILSWSVRLKSRFVKSAESARKLKVSWFPWVPAVRRIGKTLHPPDAGLQRGAGRGREHSTDEAGAERRPLARVRLGAAAQPQAECTHGTSDLDSIA